MHQLKKVENNHSKNHARRRFILVCTVPAFLLFTIFVIYPAFQVFYMSLFRRSSLGLKTTFVGLDNFKTLFQDEKFHQAFLSQIFFIVVVTIITMTLSMLFAGILSQTKLREVPFYRTVFFFPNVLSMVVISVLFVQIYDPTKGILNSTLKAIRAQGLIHTWLGDDSTVLWCIAAAMVWQAVGYYMVIYMASMDGIQKDLYEVADLEGMGKLKQFFKITLPLMWEVVRVTIVFFIISTINMSFTFVKVMAPEHSNVLLTYMYKQAFGNNNYGYSMAIGVSVFLFAFLLAILCNKLTAKEVIES